MMARRSVHIQVLCVVAGLVLCTVLGLLGLTTVAFWCSYFLAVASSLLADWPCALASILCSVIGSNVLVLRHPPSGRAVSVLTLLTADAFFFGTALMTLVLSQHLRRQVRRAVRASENVLPLVTHPGPQHLYARMVDLSPDGVVCVDSAGLIVLFNQQAEEMFGYSRDEVLGQPVDMLLPADPAMRARHVQHRAHYMAQPSTRAMGARLDLQARRKDGRTFPAEVALAPIVRPEDNGRADPRYIVKASVRDVTWRRHMEAALAEREWRMSALVQASNQILYRMSPDWSEMRELTGGGVIEDTPISRGGDWEWRNRYILPEDQEHVTAAITDAIHERRMFELEHRVRGADGGVAWVLSRAMPRLSESGDILEWFGAAGDVTAQREAQSERVKREVAEQALAERDHFITTVGHELKTPLTALAGLTERLMTLLVRTPAPLPPSQQERVAQSLSFIAAQTQRLVGLVTALLEAGRMQTGRFRLVVETVDLAALLHNQVALRQLLGPSQTLVVDADPVVLRGDSARLEQVIANVLDNAIRFSPPKGRVLITLRANQTSVRLAVRDFGPGIPAEARTHIFERFYQAHTKTYPGGLGLGLYLTKSIVELHKGRIWFESPPDGGTRFIVAIPRAQDQH